MVFITATPAPATPTPVSPPPDSAAATATVDAAIVPFEVAATSTPPLLTIDEPEMKALTAPEPKPVASPISL